MLHDGHHQSNNQNSRALLLSALLLIATITGCSSSSSSASFPITMMGASCAPGSRTSATPAIIAATQDIQTEEDATPGGFDFMPAFTATCRPDHQFTHLDLALAFADAKHDVAYDMQPMFGATASPASRQWRSLISPSDLVDADWR